MRVTVRQILSYLIYVSATCRVSDLVYLGLTSAKWCSWIAVTGILTDLTSYRPPEKIDLPQTGLSLLSVLSWNLGHGVFHTFYT